MLLKSFSHSKCIVQKSLADFFGFCNQKINSYEYFLSLSKRKKMSCKHFKVIPNIKHAKVGILGRSLRELWKKLACNIFKNFNFKTNNFDNVL